MRIAARNGKLLQSWSHTRHFSHRPALIVSNQWQRFSTSPGRDEVHDSSHDEEARDGAPAQKSLEAHISRLLERERESGQYSTHHSNATRFKRYFGQREANHEENHTLLHKNERSSSAPRTRRIGLGTDLMPDTTFTFESSNDTLKHKFMLSGRLSKIEIVEEAIKRLGFLSPWQRDLHQSKVEDATTMLDPFLEYGEGSEDPEDLEELFAEIERQAELQRQVQSLQAGRSSKNGIGPQFDILKEMGLRSTPSTEQTAAQNDDNGSAEAPTGLARRRVIDWSHMPLSPLINKKQVEARNSFRHHKGAVVPDSNYHEESDSWYSRIPSASDQESTEIEDQSAFEMLSHTETAEYHDAAGRFMRNDPIAAMLASNIRMCRLTKGKLPEEFLLKTTLRLNPDTHSFSEVPHGMSVKPDVTPPEYATEADYAAAFIARIENPNDESLGMMRPTANPEAIPASIAEDSADDFQLEEFDDSDVDPAMMTIQELTEVAESEDADRVDADSDVQKIQEFEEQDIDEAKDASYRRTPRLHQAYLIWTPALIQELVAMKEQLWKRNLPEQWNARKKGATLERRDDFEEFTYSLMQRQISARLRRRRQYAWPDEFPRIGLCVATIDFQARPVSLPKGFHHGAILYFGDSKNVDASETIFSKTIQAIVDSKPGISLDQNLLRTHDESEALPLAVRLSSKDWQSFIVYDMTRILQLNFLEAMRQAGYQHLAYWITRDAGFLKELWILAQYVAARTIPVEAETADA